MTAKTAKGLVRARVIKHIPQGLSVELDNGQRGIVRIREISWEEENLSAVKDMPCKTLSNWNQTLLPASHVPGKNFPLFIISA